MTAPEDATTGPATINRRWREYLDANVGVSCIGSNLVVLDVDSRDGGGRTLAELEARHGILSPTVRQVTGSGGQHILFRPFGGSPPGSLGKGIDVKWRARPQPWREREILEKVEHAVAARERYPRAVAA